MFTVSAVCLQFQLLVYNFSCLCLISTVCLQFQLFIQFILTFDFFCSFTGPALVVSVVSLLANVLLIGGSRQLSKDFLLVWIVWKSVAIFIFWLWYGYNQLKHYGYIDWKRYGMKNCIFCNLRPESTYIGKLCNMYSCT